METQPKGSFLTRAFDQFVSSVAPVAGLRRAAARAKLQAFGYEAGRISRERGYATKSGNASSESSQNITERQQLVWEARSLTANYAPAQYLLDMMVTYVLGNFEVEIRSGDRKTDTQIEEYLKVCFANFDYSGRMSFKEFSRQAFASMLRDGDFLSVPYNVTTPLGKMLQWSAIEGDRIGGDVQASNGSNYVAGVTFEPTSGKIVSFRVFDRNTNGSYSNPVEVPAKDATFLVKRNRTDAYRGVSAYATAIKQLRDSGEILDFESMAVKYNSSISTVVKTDIGGADTEIGDTFPSDTETVSPQGPRATLESIKPGTVNYLNPGESVESYVNNRPSATFQGFWDALMAMASQSFNIPYAWAFNASKLGGAALRMESAQAQRTFAFWQTFMQDRWIVPVVAKLILHGIAVGNLDVDSKFTSNMVGLAKVTNVQVRFPAHPTVDVGRESAATIAEYVAGLLSPTEIAARDGVDLETRLRERAEDYKLACDIADEFKIPVQAVLGDAKIAGVTMPLQQGMVVSEDGSTVPDNSIQKPAPQAA